tara:strand:- start:15034 stop:15174 length:141 start_codon:yes stop_codon:yes gene_type:complete
MLSNSFEDLKLCQKPRLHILATNVALILPNGLASVLAAVLGIPWLK